jgi:hypothetical protein
MVQYYWHLQLDQCRWLEAQHAIQVMHTECSAFELTRSVYRIAKGERGPKSLCFLEMKHVGAANKILRIFFVEAYIILWS